MTEAAGSGGFELLSPLPLHSAQFRWRIRIPGRSAYMGTADEYIDVINDKTQLHCADPDTFVPEE